MIKYNDEYEAEIRSIVQQNPKNYVKILKSTGFKNRYQDRSYLVDYIYQCTPMLSDDVHTFKTRLYWTLNRLQDFPVCMNKADGKEHKMITTNVKKLKDGYPCYCNSKCQHESPAYHQSVKDAFIAKYGVSNAFQISTVKEDLASRSKEIQEKRDDTRRKHFGDAPGWNLAKSLSTRKQKYGSAWNVSAIEATKEAKHGNPHWNNSEKAYCTKKLNGTLNSSRQENIVVEVAKTIMPQLKTQYKSDVYPYSCDMYDPISDTYIEYNGSWTHGGHPYDSNSVEDIAKLNIWKDKGTAYYDNAVQTWTIRDPLKRKTSAENGVKLVELWNYKDVEKYFNLSFHLDEWLYFDCPKDKLEKEYNNFKTMCLSGKTSSFLSSRNASNLIIKYFQQDVFYAREKLAWLDNNKRNQLIQNRTKYLHKDQKQLTDLDLLDGFKRSGMIYGYSHFNPKWFMWFIDKYNARVCYDPFGGWGHRMLGAAKLDKYIYNDLTTRTADNARKIAKYFKMSNVEVHNEDAALFKPNCQFDSMFTCPPYFNVEEYECGSFSSFKQYKELIDNVFKVFYSSDSCKVFGIVTREDMICEHDDYTEVYDINIGRSYHLNTNDNKKRERLYVFIKQ